MNADGLRDRCRLCGETRSDCKVAQEATLLRHTFSGEPQAQAVQAPADDRDTSNQAASEPESTKPRSKPRKLARLSKQPEVGIGRASSPATEQVSEQQRQRRRSQSAPKLYKPPIEIYKDPDTKERTISAREDSIGQANALQEVAPNPRTFLRRRSSSLPTLKPRPAVSTTTTTPTTPSTPSTPYKERADPFVSSSRRSSRVLGLGKAQAQHKSKDKPQYRLVLNPQGKAVLGASQPPGPAVEKAQQSFGMRKTLLLCFIHGFKGGDDTFGIFPEHLRVLVSHALPKIAVATITYPKYETRGDLHECVARFKEWLQNKVIDLEVANGTPSPTIDPSVHTILVGHSMGGIVAAETVLSIIEDKPIPPSTSSSAPEDPNSADDSSSFMFPSIQGILAFDTPYLGIAPGVVAHEAEGHWNAATAAYSTYSQVASAFFRRPGEQEVQAVEASKMLPAPGTPTANADVDAAAVPAWQRWGKYAMFAGAAGAVVAGGAAAYKKREQLSEGWQWVGSHLEFVGCLARGQELQKRINAIAKLEESHSLGFADLYTCLGAAVQGKSYWSSGVLGEQRTFCTIPKSDLKKYFLKMTNDAARAETWAHMSMFTPKQNPGYYSMCEKAKELIVAWVSGEWYDDAEVDPNAIANANIVEDGDDVEMAEKPEENCKPEEDAQPEENAEPDAGFEKIEKTEPQDDQ